MERTLTKIYRWKKDGNKYVLFGDEIERVDETIKLYSVDDEIAKDICVKEQDIEKDFVLIGTRWED